jgi:high-affinity iron transporter
MNFSVALPTFIVTLREGFEAALVVGIVLACLEKAQQTPLNRWVYLGIGGGIFASVMVGWLLWDVLQGVESSQSFYAPVVKQLLEGIFGVVAMVMLTWMLLWMSKQAKYLKAEVEGAINNVLAKDNNVGKGIFLLVFIAVLREGFETVLFIVAKFQQEIISPTLGAMAGLTLAAMMGFVLFFWGIKLNIRLFFQIMGVFLLLIVGGLLIGTLKHFDAAVTILASLNPNYLNWCIFENGACLLGIQVWDGSNILPDRQFPGILLKTLFGYREKIYLIQVIAYSLFLTIIGSSYLASFPRKFDSKKELKLEN